MILYIVRHGDPDYANNTITPLGHKEAKALSLWFDGIPLDRIYTSPLGRAKDTAAYTCERQNITPSVLPWTEESMDYMRPFPHDAACSYRFSTDEGVTDFRDFYDEDRSEILRKLAAESDAFLASCGYERQGAHYRIVSPNEERIAVFCHGGFGTAWTAHLLGMPPSLGFLSMFMTTTSVTTFEFCDHESGFTRPRMIRFGEISHLVNTDIPIELNT